MKDTQGKAVCVVLECKCPEGNSYDTQNKRTSLSTELPNTKVYRYLKKKNSVMNGSLK